MEVRKIVSKDSEGKKRKRNQLIVGGILIIVMIFSTIGFAFQGNGPGVDDGTVYSYNGYDFVQQNGLWIAQIGQATFGFLYHPTHTEDIEVETKTLSNYVGMPLYISSSSPSAEQEIYRNLDQVILRRQYACLEGQNCTGDIPIKTCEDNFIIIKEDVVNNIVQDQNCIYIIGNAKDLPKVADEFLFRIMGVK